LPDAARLAAARKVIAKVDAAKRLPANIPEVYAFEQQYIHDQPTRELKVQDLAIGDLAIVTWPNEVYALSGLKVKRQSPFALTFSITQANGADGYIPPPEQHKLGGYTTWPARSAGLVPEAEPTLVELHLKSLEALSGKPRRPLGDANGDYAKAVLAAKPAAYWRLEGMAGNQAADSSGNGVTAELEDGVALYLEGPTREGFSGKNVVNRAVHFAGGRLQANQPGAADKYSVEFWFWNGFPNDARGVTAYLASQVPADGQVVADQLGIGGRDGKPGRLFFASGDPQKPSLLTGETIVEPKTWNHVALVRDGQQVRVYLNGNAKPEIEGTVTAAPATTIGGWLFAGRPDGASNLEGKLDEIAVYAQALPPQEVAAHFAAAGEPQAPAMVDGPAVPAVSPAPAVKPDVPSDKGLTWKPLFNGKDFQGWRTWLAGIGLNKDPQHVFQVEDGAIHIYKDARQGEKMPHGYLCTEAEYSHYRLRFQYRWGTKRFAPRAQTIRDAGVIYHVFGKDGVWWDTWASGVEYQVQEGDTGDIFTVGATVSSFGTADKPPRFLEQAQGGKPVTIGTPKKVERLIHAVGKFEQDGWNTCEIIVEGDKATHFINGRVNNRCFDIRRADPDGSDKLVPLTRGQILFQAEGAEVFYRNLEIAELPVKEAAAPEKQALVPPPPVSPQESLAHLKVSKGFEVQLVVAEPMVIDPVAIAWGADGKLWVAEMADYPLGKDNQGGACGRIRYLEDTNADGQYDRSTLFLENVNFPNGIIAWKKGVLVTAAPEIFYAEDTNGDGKADVRKTLYSGFIPGNPQLRVNGLQWGLDGWLYCANGWSGGVVKSEQTGEKVDIRGRDLRIHPDTGRMDLLAGVTEFGRNRNWRGDWFGCDNSNPIWHFALEDRYTRRNTHFAPPDARHQLMAPPNPKVFAISAPQKRYHHFNEAERFTSACAVMTYGDQWLFPPGPQQHAFVCEPVHNLVHHQVLSQQGSSYTSTRAPGEEQREFLASDDGWFRPVMTRTGPDGALWVVDMYRYMIEHPEFLPPEGKAELEPFYRLGEDRGRIYRIVPTGKRSGLPPRLDQLTTAELVAALDTANDWQRDTAQQQLMWRADASAVPALEALVREGRLPQARFQALATLAGLNAMGEETVLAALKDQHPAVRRQALRSSEALRQTSRLELALFDAVADPDGLVQQQLAATLGMWTSPKTAVALAALAMNAPADRYLQSTVLSSIRTENVSAVLRHLLDNGDRVAPAVMQAMLEQAIATDHHAEVLVAIDRLPADARQWTPDQAATFTRIISAFAHRQKSFPQIAAKSGAEGSRAMERLASFTTIAREVAADAQATLQQRRIMIEFLGAVAENRAEDRQVLTELLVPQTDTEVQKHAIQRLAALRDADIGTVLLQNWASYTPAIRQQIMQCLVSRSEWTGQLLSAIASGVVAPADIDTTTRQRLLQLPEKALKAQAEKVFAVAGDGDRQQVISRLQGVLKLSGNAAAGKEVFKQKCSVCHRLENVGHEVGPNLAALTDKSPVALLQAILDPSRGVETRYMNYLAITSDGRSFSGILASETGSHITLLMQEGKEQVILREDLEQIRSSAKSLMPEGFERELTPQNLADLLAYLGR
jgi:putative membrane-bound dehydrogenase-like protein